MAEKVLKTYLSDKPSLSVSVEVDGKFKSIAFVGGKFSTDVEHEQEAVEACERFRSGHITLAPAPLSPREVLVNAVAKCQADADNAGKALSDAKAALAEFDKKNAPVPAKAAA